jgi:hypothetical protein
LQPHIGGDEGKKDHGNHTVHGEEGGIETAEVARGNERVLVCQQKARGCDAEPSGDPKVEETPKPDQQSQHGQMHNARRPKRCGNPDCLGKAVKAGGPVMLEVLARVENVESADPKCYCCGEDKNARIEAATNPSTRCDQRVTRFM